MKGFSFIRNPQQLKEKASKTLDQLFHNKELKLDRPPLDPGTSSVIVFVTIAIRYFWWY